MPAPSTADRNLIFGLLALQIDFVSREQLLDGVWGSDIYIDERTVDVHVGRLRKAINRGHMADPIRTVRGAGYALDDRFGRMN